MKCQQCQKEFTPTHWKQVCCCDECKYDRRLTQNREYQRVANLQTGECPRKRNTRPFLLPERTCKRCKAKFTPKTANQTTYCSAECRETQWMMQKEARRIRVKMARDIYFGD